MHNQNTYIGPSFSLKNRCMRALWNCVYFLLFRTSPHCMHTWRVFLLKLFGARIKKGCHIYPSAKIWAPWNLECEEGVGIANGAIIYNQGMIRLGSYAVISQEAFLCTGTHDYSHRGFLLVTKEIIIEKQAWVAARAFIHPGVRIGEGCVIGACAVVTKNMPKWMVCAGHPCKPLHPRILQ